MLLVKLSDMSMTSGLILFEFSVNKMARQGKDLALDPDMYFRLYLAAMQLYILIFTLGIIGNIELQYGPSTSYSSTFHLRSAWFSDITLTSIAAVVKAWIILFQSAELLFDKNPP